jgi:hypothetical protein
LLYGSGLRLTPDGGAPNSGTLPHYMTVNSSLTHSWTTPVGKLEGRLALINLFDKSYLLRDGSGVGGRGTAVWCAAHVLRRLVDQLLTSRRVA